MNNSNDCTQAEAPMRPEKHVLLVGAIERLDEIYWELQRVHSRVLGNNETQEVANVNPEVKQKIPPLAKLLNEGPELIHTRINNILQQIHMIEEDLF